MPGFNKKYFPLTTVLTVILTNPLFSQLPDFAKISNLHQGDSLNISYLIAHGVKTASGKTICWFPVDSLPEKRMNEIADMINTGIKAAEKFIHAPLPWQAHSTTEPYTFYFRLDSFVSHASGSGFVSIPFWRIKNDKAPWLHEAIHEMLNTKTLGWFNPAIKEEEWSKNMPLWLFEGLPDYISQKVSQLENLPRFDVFSKSNSFNVDSLFTSDIKSEKGVYILSFIGTKGVMPELSSKDRSLYAPAFYHGSCSFVQYIATHYDFKIFLDAISSFGEEHAIIEKRTGKPLAILKKEWLSKLKPGTD